MTVLSAIQDACAVIGIDQPDAVFSATAREFYEIRALANEMAERIRAAHDWQVLQRRHTLTGDGSTEDFALPADYDRMLKDTKLWSSRIETPLTHITSRDRWLELDIRSYEFVIGVWILYGGELHIKPAMVTGETAQFFYVSQNIVADSSGTPKVAFTADSDVLRVDERLLSLGMIWQWRANKGLPYAEDMANYEALLAKRIADDKGARVLTVGRRRMTKGVAVSYPQAIPIP